MTTINYEQTFNPTEKETQVLIDLLIQYNKQHFEVKEKKPFSIYAKSDDLIIGGIHGEIFGDWMNIKYLAVDEAYRNQKIGSKLLTDAEKLAKEKHCKHIFISTYGFQGKDYYPKFGFKEVLVRENYPLTGTEHYLIKNL